ncbi:Phytocyanin domain, partial [Dillenia turbinata]
AVVIAVAAIIQSTDAQTTYMVGDNLGWLVPSAASNFNYSTWASSHTFGVGDTLVFNFTTGVHDVAVVTRDAYDACNSTTPLDLKTIGPLSYVLNSTGDFYFLCTFGRHCLNGQKLHITVTTTGPSASPLPAPSPSHTPSNPPSGTTTPTPPPPPTNPTGGSPPPPSSASSTSSTAFFMTLGLFIAMVIFLNAR